MIKQSLLNEAIQLAKKSQMGQRHGAILISSGAVFGRGTNSSDRSQYGKIVFPGAHAELNAIRSCSSTMPYFEKRKKDRYAEEV